MSGGQRRFTVAVLVGSGALALSALVPMAMAGAATHQPTVVITPGSQAPASAAPTTTTPLVVDPFQPVPTTAPVATPAATAHVSIVDFGFSPASITVTAGTTVTWTNTGAATHSVTSDTGAFDSDPTCPSGPCINPGSSFSHTFATAGTFSYHCRVHTFMTGTVIVTAVATTTTPTTTPGSTPGSTPTGPTTTTKAGTPPVSAGGSATPSTTTPGATGPQLAFTGTPAEEAWIALGALLTIAAGLALRPRRRPFPIPVATERSDPSGRPDPS